MKSNNNILMNGFSQTNYTKRRLRGKKKTKPKPKQNKKNKHKQKPKKNKKVKKIKRTNTMSIVVKALKGLYPDVDIEQLNKRVRLRSLLSERNLPPLCQD